MKNQDMKHGTSEVKMMGERSAVILTDDEIGLVSGARWVSTWCAVISGGCVDSEFIN